MVEDCRRARHWTMQWVAVVGAVSVLLAGCLPGSTDRARSEVVGMGDSTRAEAVDVFESVARGVQATKYSGSGSASYVGCTDLLANQLKYGAELVIMDANLPPEERSPIVERFVVAAGWTISRRMPAGIRAQKEGLRLSASYRGRGMLMKVDTECVKASRRLVREFGPGSRVTLGLQPPVEPPQ